MKLAEEVAALFNRTTALKATKVEKNAHSAIAFNVLVKAPNNTGLKDQTAAVINIPHVKKDSDLVATVTPVLGSRTGSSMTMSGFRYDPVEEAFLHGEKGDPGALSVVTALRDAINEWKEAQKQGR